MTKQSHQSKATSAKELLFANHIRNKALVQILVEKGVITEQEYRDKLEKVMSEYRDIKIT
jgi:hypothetical protein